MTLAERFEPNAFIFGPADEAAELVTVEFQGTGGAMGLGVRIFTFTWTGN